MLACVHIENIAVIKSIDIDLTDGFCAVTGETGAGKSVIMQALKMLSGGKLDRDLVRRGEERAQISGLFSDVPEDVQTLLSDMGYECEDGELLVVRSVGADGRSSVKINGKSATAAMQKNVVGRLLDIHSQHDSITLLDRKTHMSMLDRYAGADELLCEYRGKYSKYSETKRKIAELEAQRAESERQLDFLRMQIKELEGAKLKEGEEEKLEEEKKRLSSIEKVRKQASFAYRAIYGGERGNACMLLDKSITSLSAVSDDIPEFSALVERLREAYYEICDIAEGLAEYADDGEDPTQKLDKIETRLDAYSKLKRKYNTDTAGMLEYLSQIKAKADMFENIDGAKDELDAEYKAREEELRALSDALSAVRKNAAHTLSESVGEVLRFLDMPKVRFEVCVTGARQGYTPDGADEVAFMLSMSEAEPMIELSDASGGELSRVMLALKSVLCEKFGAQTVVYDEIDTGVSGKTARKIGIKLKQSALDSQVICVTHSAQIASLADTHLRISKRSSDGRFESEVCELDRAGRILELSRILGGINITDAQRQAAEDMLRGEDVL